MQQAVGKFTHEPTSDLMMFLNDIVEKEWVVLSEGLKQTGEPTYYT